jgi:hypothetical protein
MAVRAVWRGDAETPNPFIVLEVPPKRLEVVTPSAVSTRMAATATKAINRAY